MPYQVQAQSVQFQNIATSEYETKRMRKAAQDLGQQRKDEVAGLQAQASGQLAEMQRIDALEKRKSAYELEKLRFFSESLNQFAQKTLVDAHNMYHKSKVATGVEERRKWDQGDPDARVKLDARELALTENEKKAQELSTTVAETDADLREKIEKLKALTPEEIQEYRRSVINKALGPYERIGWNKESLRIAAKNWPVHLQTKLSELGDLSAEDKELHVRNIELDYAAQVLGGLDANESLADKYLYKPITTYSEKEIQNGYVVQLRETLNEKNDLTEASFINDIETADVETLVTNIPLTLRSLTAYHRLQKLDGDANQWSRKRLRELLVTGLSQVGEDDERIDEVLSAFDNAQLKDHPAGPGSLTKHYPDEFNIRSIRAESIVKRYSTFSNNQKLELQAMEVRKNSLLEIRYSDEPGAEEKFAEGIVLFKEEFKDNPRFPQIYAKLTESPELLSEEVANNEAQALLLAFDEQIPKEYFYNWPISVQKTYKEFKVDNVWGTDSLSKQNQINGQTAIRDTIAYEFKSNSNLADDPSLKLAGTAAITEIIPRAKELYKNKGYQSPSGWVHVSTQAQAIKIASEQIANEIKHQGNITPDKQVILPDGSLKYKWLTDSDGFIYFKGASPDIGRLTAPSQMRIQVNKAEQLSAKNPDFTKTDIIIKDPKKLTLNAFGRAHPLLYRLKDMSSKGTTVYDVINNQRRLLGDKNDVHKELDKKSKLIVDLIKTDEQTKRELSRNDAKTTARVMDRLNTLDITKLTNTMPTPEITDLPKSLSEAGLPNMSRVEYNNNPEVQAKLKRFLVNKAWGKANTLYQGDSGIRIKLIAAILSGDSLEDWEAIARGSNYNDLITRYYAGGF